MSYTNYLIRITHTDGQSYAKSKATSALRHLSTIILLLTIQ